MLLIQRIYSLLTYTQKEKLIQNFKSLSSSEIWKFDLFFSKDSNFDIFLMHNINNSFANIVENIVYIENDFAPNYIIVGSIFFVVITLT